MRAVLWLEQMGAKDRAQVGSKALNLAEIRRVGFAVPNGFCVSAAVYQDHMADHNLHAAVESLQSLPVAQAQSAASRLQEQIRVASMRDEVRDAALYAYRALMASTDAARTGVAVRSSASAEDLPTASFAGQQGTALNVRGEQLLLEAIKDCWASLWSQRTVLYRSRHGKSPHDPVMAVLVQVMVDAQAAGVAFSRHPTTGEESILIEAALGLGDAVVDGTGDVDCYLVSAETLAEIEPPIVAHKLHKRALDAQGGLQNIAVPMEACDARVLTPKQVSQVAEAAIALEQHFGCPQDMEWALAEGHLYVLQSRPITTLARSFFTDTIPGDTDIWTSGFLNERFGSPVSPLGWSVINELLEELAFRDPLRYLGVRDVERWPITKLYRGHPYVNLLVFQTLYKVFPDALLPEDAYRYFPAGETKLRFQVQYPRSLFDPHFLLSMAQHFLRQPQVWSPWHNHRAWTTFAARHEKLSQRLENEFHSLQDPGATGQRIWALLEKAQQLNAELLSLHRWSLTLADLTYTLLRRLARAWLETDTAITLCTHLVTGLPNRSLEIDSALYRLAQLQDTPAFSEAFAAFQAHYGHRSFHLDIYYPSFADEPDQIVALLPSLRQRDREWDDNRVELREEAERAVRESLSSGPLPRARRTIFDQVLHLARCYMPLREEQRFYWQRTLALMRRLFLALGKHMAGNGILCKPAHIFFLTKSEIDAYVHQRLDCSGYATLATTREQQFRQLQQEFDVAPQWSYPPFLRGNAPLEIKPLEGTDQFRGRAVSPGLARGRVVVLFSPAEFAKVRQGDVLVARSIDPGWTPIFGLLNALIVEHGGQLSHGAVVAREYGLPAVAGIPGITRMLHDDDMVIVDGTNGVVRKHASGNCTRAQDDAAEAGTCPH